MGILSDQVWVIPTVYCIIWINLFIFVAFYHTMDTEWKARVYNDIIW